MLKIVNPATQSLLAKIPVDTAASIKRKYRLARAAQPAWARLPALQRIDALKRFREALREQRETLAQILTSEVGKPIAQSRNELAGVLGRIDFFVDNAAEMLKDEVVFRRRRREARGKNQFRAARRRRQHFGVELSVLRGRERVRAGAADRERGAVQAVRVCDADRTGDSKVAARSGRAGRRVRAGGRRRRSRCAARTPSPSTGFSLPVRTRPAPKSRRLPAGA
jgi:hypothetical protein